MPKLRREGDELRLSLSGSQDFQADLGAAKAIPGRFYDGDSKEWVYLATPDNASRLMQTIRVAPEDDVVELVRDQAEETAAMLAAAAGDDAELNVPWADQLFPYQRAGAAYIAENRTVLVADDMGLGKTVQTISGIHEIAYRAASGGEQVPSVLVIAPSSLLLTWADEFQQWAGRDDITVLDTKTKRQREKQFENAQPIVAVNYEKLAQTDDVLKRLRKMPFDAIVLDEAHRIKNYRAKQTRAVWKLKAPVRIALSGTPILNSPDELFGPLHFIDPITFNSYWSFFHSHVNYYEGFYGQIITGVRDPDGLRFALRGKLIRRTKKQVLKDLPEKLPIKRILLNLTPLQRRLYNEAENEFWVDVEQAIKDEESDDRREHLAAAALAGDLKTLSYMIPNAGAKVARQRQIISSPALLGGKDESAKLDAVMDLVMDHPDEKFVIFTGFQQTAELITARINKALKDENAAAYFHGEVKPVDRKLIADDFQEGRVKHLAMTYQTGGQGITLTAARMAIFIEQDWTPGINDQALDRLHRIGQEREVQGIYLQARDTLDVDRVEPTNKLKTYIVTSVLGAD